MHSDSTTIFDIYQQLNDIEVCHIYIFNIIEYNAYSNAYRHIYLQTLLFRVK